MSTQWREKNEKKKKNSLNLTDWRRLVTSVVQEVLAPQVVPGAVRHHLDTVLPVLVQVAVVRLAWRPVGELGFQPVGVPHPATFVHQVVQTQPHRHDS